MVRRISKHMLEPTILLELISSIGMTELGDVWADDLEPSMQKVVNHKLVQVASTTVPTATSDLSEGSVRDARGYITHNRFYLTQRGRKFLRLWPLEELLDQIRNGSGGFFVHKQYALVYVVNRLPLEKLPEYLAHSSERVRTAAEKRQNCVILV